MGEKGLSALDGALIISGTSVGAGMLALPIAFQDIGLVLSCAVLLCLGAFNLVSFLLIVELMARADQPLHLPRLIERYVGPKASLLMSLAISISVYGALTAYLLLGAGAINSLTGIPAVIGMLAYFIVASVIVWYGIWWLRNAERVMFTFAIALIGVLLFAALPNVGPAPGIVSLATLPAAFGVAFFAYSAHQLIPSVGNRMGRKYGEFAKAVAFGLIVPVVIYTVWTLILVWAIPLPLLAEARANGDAVIAPLAKLSHWSETLVGGTFNPILVIGSVYVLFATITSFIGLGFCLADALQDAYREWWHTPLKRSTAVVAVVVPGLAFALYDPRALLRVLEVTGAYSVCTIVALICIAYLNARKVRTKKVPGFVVPFGAPLAVICLLVALAAIVIETLSLVSALA